MQRCGTHLPPPAPRAATRWMSMLAALPAITAPSFFTHLLQQPLRQHLHVTAGHKARAMSCEYAIREELAEAGQELVPLYCCDGQAATGTVRLQGGARAVQCVWRSRQRGQAPVPWPQLGGNLTCSEDRSARRSSSLPLPAADASAWLLGPAVPWPAVICLSSASAASCSIRASHALTSPSDRPPACCATLPMPLLLLLLSMLPAAMVEPLQTPVAACRAFSPNAAAASPSPCVCMQHTKGRYQSNGGI